MFGVVPLLSAGEDAPKFGTKPNGFKHAHHPIGLHSTAARLLSHCAVYATIKLPDPQTNLMKVMAYPAPAVPNARKWNFFFGKLFFFFF
jgi:hypothetical protein